MLAKIDSYGICGLDAFPVCIETDVSPGLPKTVIVGLPDNAIMESKERVRAAIRNSGFKYKSRRITINLSPADIRKEGPAFDLAIALGILAAGGQIDPALLENFIILGELSLDGHIRPIRGTLPILLSIPKNTGKAVILPSANTSEAVIADALRIYPASTLAQVVQFLTQTETILPLPPVKNTLPSLREYDTDFAEVRGQGHVKRGIEIAAAGGHNCLMIGPPGSGKTMLAKRIPTILPDMTREESLQTTKIHSVMGMITPGHGLITARPFRSPHHTASYAALVGGGPVPKPGEITLSHNGVLFLDELPEFNRSVLESLRQPLEDRCVTISRAARAVRFPADFMLVASMNPCPCGYYTDPRRECHCPPPQIQRYLARISGPLLDRIDIHLEVPALDSAQLMNLPSGENSSTIKTRTLRARAVQQERFRDRTIFCNAQMTDKQLRQACPLSPESRTLLETAIRELALSARAYGKILKVSRTIADLDGRPDIQPPHLAEAIQYRSLDRSWWS